MPLTSVFIADRIGQLPQFVTLITPFRRPRASNFDLRWRRKEAVPGWSTRGAAPETGRIGAGRADRYRGSGIVRN